MRYFYQDKTYEPDFNEETQVVVEETENHITWSWNITKQEETIYREVEHDDGSNTKFVDDVIPEEGEWVYESEDGYVNTGKTLPPVIGSHETHGELETISIIRDLTEEEIEERQREKEQQEQEAQEAQERAEQLDTYIKTGEDEITLNTDVPNEDNAHGGGGAYVSVSHNSAICSTPKQVAGEELNTKQIVNIEYLEQRLQDLEAKLAEK